ncbi:hypothetical protein NUW58_g2380 [Xylaria curta]|uniref:Uncharacterized protein n=1 Tax=Xylaria curta TaxID=42375 RepID=A0ACC1PJ33_9PEZI|nr:hypothetical protein NUW58_g2380 [Xylaria curta]
MALGYAMRFGGLALALIAGFPSNLLQPSQAAVIETTVILTSETLPQETSTTSSINPWPTDTTYTWPSEEECIATSTDGSPGNCLLSLTAWHSDPGFMTNYCGRKSFTTTETRTLTVDCGGCDQLKVSVGVCEHPGAFSSHNSGLSSAGVGCRVSTLVGRVSYHGGGLSPDDVP